MAVKQPISPAETVFQYEKDLNHPERARRLAAIQALSDLIKKDELATPETGTDVNNHIHTTYSFSPYSPAKSVWMAYQAGLQSAGIMDHDSLSGAEEFIEAGKVIGLATTIGVECRADFKATRLGGKRINNPDQKTVAYVALHGVPHQNIGQVADFFKPFQDARNRRNQQMTDALNEIGKPLGVKLDFNTEVAALSQAHDGGTITERHILFAFGRKLIEQAGKGEALVTLIKDKLHLQVSRKNEAYLTDPANPFYEYDLLGALKSDMVQQFYIEAADECPGIDRFIEFCREVNGISAYAYLGDVGDSVTGDKKRQKFEDDYIELLFEELARLKFQAVTYMPSRNTLAQLKRVKSFCDQYGLLQISGEDINSPRQPFVCTAVRDQEFVNLIDTTWALIGHEKEATKDIENGFFSQKNIDKYPSLEQRIRYFKELGLRV